MANSSIIKPIVVSVNGNQSSSDSSGNEDNESIYEEVDDGGENFGMLCNNNEELSDTLRDNEESDSEITVYMNNVNLSPMHNTTW